MEQRDGPPALRGVAVPVRAAKRTGSFAGRVHVMSFILQQRDGVRFYRSDLLPCPHAFSTRAGGISTLPHLYSMNIGENRGDEPGNPEKNLAILTRAAGLPPSVVSAAQVHGTSLLYVGSAPQKGAPKPELDGFYTDKEGITLCVKVADCMPILLCDKRSGAVAALHAGWRGCASDIAAEGVKALVSLGARPRDLVAAIGPSIHSCCFEVKEDFVAEFTKKAGKDASDRFILRKGEKTYADLQGCAAHFLRRAGIPPEQIDVCPLCTCCDPATFFSHRKTGGVRGTMGALIAVSPRP